MMWNTKHQLDIRSLRYCNYMNKKINVQIYVKWLFINSTCTCKLYIPSYWQVMPHHSLKNKNKTTWMTENLLHTCTAHKYNLLTIQLTWIFWIIQKCNSLLLWVSCKTFIQLLLWNYLSMVVSLIFKFIFLLKIKWHQAPKLWTSTCTCTAVCITKQRKKNSHE